MTLRQSNVYTRLNERRSLLYLRVIVEVASIGALYNSRPSL